MTGCSIISTVQSFKNCLNIPSCHQSCVVYQASLSCYSAGYVRWYQEDNERSIWRSETEGIHWLHWGPGKGRINAHQLVSWQVKRLQLQCTINIAIVLLYWYHVCPCCHTSDDVPPTGGLLRLHWWYSLHHLWCGCWHLSQWQFCQAGLLVSSLLLPPIQSFILV